MECDSLSMRVPIIRRLILLLLSISLILLLIKTVFSAFELKCKKGQPSFRNLPILIVNHSDVASEPKGLRAVSFIVSPNTSICHQNIVVVHSHIANVNERNRLRKVFQSTPFRLLFVLGIEHVRSVENLTEKIFNDLLIIDIVEDYHNITYKAQSWIRYISEECADVRWIVKMDDDVEVNPLLLESLLLSHRHYSRVLMGRVYLNNRVVRNRQSKWFLSPSEYSSEWLGEYLQGMSYVISGDLLSSMATNIERVQYLWMDDWYVTHALLNGTFASLINISPLVASANSREEIKELRRRKESLLFMHLRPKEEFPPVERNRIWREIQTQCPNNL